MKRTKRDTIYTVMAGTIQPKTGRVVMDKVYGGSNKKYAVSMAEHYAQKMVPVEIIERTVYDCISR